MTPRLAPERTPDEARADLQRDVAARVMRRIDRLPPAKRRLIWGEDYDAAESKRRMGR